MPWSVSVDVNTNATSLEETQQCIGEFYDTLSDVITSIQRHEDRLASHQALGVAANDRRHFDKIRVSLHVHVYMCVSNLATCGFGLNAPCLSRCALHPVEYLSCFALREALSA